jgi:hypothetical protein
MTSPIGLGWWVAFESAMHPGGKEFDIRTGVERATRTGGQWVALRLGDGGNKDADISEASVRAWKQAGFDVYVWQYARPQTIDAEIKLYDRFRPFVDGVIINAEFHHAGASPNTAKKLVDGLRAAGFDFVAHAPPDYAGSANAEPWNTFDALCDAIMPQVYAWEHDDRGHVHHLNNVRARYKNKGVDLEKVWPILCSYRPKVRGFTKDNKPIPTPSMAGEATRVAADLIEGLEHEWVKESQAPSIYSLDAITFINGKDDLVVDTMERWDRSQRTTEPPTTHDDGRDRAALALKNEIERVMSMRDPKDWSDAG